MARTGEGCILNISSMNAFRPLTRIPAYSAAKAGINNFTQWLAVDMAKNVSSEKSGSMRSLPVSSSGIKTVTC